MTDVAGFGVKATAAIAFMKGKLPERSLAWDDLAGPVHAKVFAVAGATNLDLVRQLHEAITSAIENGTTITDFRKSFDQAVAQHGWSYNGSRGWRTRVIFDANVRSAHMAGRWSQLWAGRDRRPFLEYRTAGDARVRPQHRQWNGIIRPLTDPFWSTHYPPNGWGCRCTVRSRSQAEIDAKGLRVETAPFEGKTRQVTKGDEVTDMVPVGIDPGWDHNVGVSWASPELALGAKLARLPASLRGQMVDKTISPAFQKAIEANWKAFQSTVKATGKPRADVQILGFLDSATMNAMAELAQTVPEADLASGAIVAFDNRTSHLGGARKASGNPAQVWTQDQIDELPSLLRDYKAVLWDSDSKALVFVPNPDATWQEKDRLPRIVIRPNVKTRYGKALSLVSLGSAEPPNLMEPHYRVLVGGLK